MADLCLFNGNIFLNLSARSRVSDSGLSVSKVHLYFSAECFGDRTILSSVLLARPRTPLLLICWFLVNFSPFDWRWLQLIRASERNRWSIKEKNLVEFLDMSQDIEESYLYFYHQLWIYFIGERAVRTWSSAKRQFGFRKLLIEKAVSMPKPPVQQSKSFDLFHMKIFILLEMLSQKMHLCC